MYLVLLMFQPGTLSVDQDLERYEGVDEKCLSPPRAFAHLDLLWWCCLGGYGSLGGGTLLEEVCHWA